MWSKEVLMNSDGHIISLILAGNARQFGVLVDRYKDRAFALAFRLLKSREEAEEAVQDSFVRAYRSIAEFRGESGFGTWFYRILYNNCMTRLSRRPEAMVSIHASESNEGENIIESGEPDLLDGIVAGERYELLNSEIQQLPEKYRTIVLLFYVQEQRYEEIATILEVPVSTVKTHLFRARALLKKRLMDRYNEETRAA
jgi:RNA polymerase sigma-70 factor, ECF subfamily